MKHIDQVIAEAKRRYDSDASLNAFVSGYRMGANDERDKAISLEREVQKLADTINRMYAQRDQLTDKLAHVELALKAEQEKSQQLRNKLHDSIADHSEANLLCAERYDKIKALEATNARLVLRDRDITVENTALRKEVAELKAANNQIQVGYNEQLERIRAHRDDALGRCSRLRHERREVGIERDKLKAENTSLREARAGMRRTVCVITSEGVVECATKEDANKVSALTRVLAAALDKIEELQKRLTSEVSILTDNFTKANDALRAERDRHHARATELHMKLAETEMRQFCGIPRPSYSTGLLARSVDVLHQLNIERSVHEQTKLHLRTERARTAQLSERICHLEARDKILTSFEGTLNALMAQACAKKA